MTTFERLRHDLAAARANGEPFDRAWSAAITALGRTAPYDRWVLGCTREAWEAAYNLWDAPRPVRAFSLLAYDAELTVPRADPAPTAPTLDQRQRIAAERDASRA